MSAPSQKMRPISGGALDQPLLRGRQPVDACGDQRLQRVRHAVAIERVPSDSASIRIVSSTKSGLPSVIVEDLGATRLLERRPAISASISCSASSSASGSSSIAAARNRPPPHDGRTSSSSGRASAEDDQRRVAHVLGEVLDQLEQRLLRPVDVLEDEHERLRARRAAPPTRARPTRSPAGCARPRRPRARRPRGRGGRRSASSSQHARSLSNASRPARRR